MLNPKTPAHLLREVDDQVEVLLGVPCSCSAAHLLRRAKPLRPEGLPRSARSRRRPLLLPLLLPLLPWGRPDSTSASRLPALAPGQRAPPHGGRLGRCRGRAARGVSV